MGKKHGNTTKHMMTRRSTWGDAEQQRIDAMSLAVNLHGALGRFTLKEDCIDPGSVVRTADVFRAYLASGSVPEEPPIIETPTSDPGSVL